MDDKEQPKLDASNTPEDNGVDNPDKALVSLPASSGEKKAADVSAENVISITSASAHEDEQTDVDIEENSGADKGDGPVQHPSQEQQEKARRRQAAYLQERRAKKKRSVGLSRLRRVMKFVLMVAMCVGLYSVATSPVWVFSAEKFVLHDNAMLKHNHIVRYVASYDGQAIYRVNPSALAKVITEEVSLVEAVYVRRRLFPTQLDISVVEKPVWGLSYEQSPVVAEDANTWVSKADFAQESPMYLLHTKGQATDLAEYQLTKEDTRHLTEAFPIVISKLKLKESTLLYCEQLIVLLSSRPQQATFQWLDASNPYDVMAVFDSFKVRLGRLDSSATQRAARLFQIMDEVRRYEQQIEYVDLRWEHQITFKKKGMTE